MLQGVAVHFMYRTSDAGGRYGNTAVVRLAPEVLTLPPFLQACSNYSLVTLRVYFEKSSLHSLHCFFTDPMEEDILQVVKYCTDLIEEKDLEKLDLVVKYMKR